MVKLYALFSFVLSVLRPLCICQVRSASNVEVNPVQNEGLTVEAEFWERFEEAKVAILAYTNTNRNDLPEDEHETVREDFKELTRSRVDLVEYLVKILMKYKYTPADDIRALQFHYVNLSAAVNQLESNFAKVNKDAPFDKNEVKQKGINALKKFEEKISAPYNDKETMQTFTQKVFYEIEVICSIIVSYKENHTEEFSLGYKEERRDYKEKMSKIDTFLRENLKAKNSSTEFGKSVGDSNE